MKFSLSILTDTLFSMFISFLLFFVLVNYFMPRPYSIICSTSLAIIFTAFALKHMLKKRQKNFGQKLMDKEYEDALIQLNLMPKIELLNYFENVLIKNGYLVEKRHGMLYIKDKNVCLFFKFGFEIVNKADIVRAFNLKNKDEVCYFIAESFSEDVQNFALRFENIVTINAKKLYPFLKEKDCLPENKYSLNKPTFDKLKALKSLFKRKRAKTFALYGILFLIMSYFVLLKTYYLVCCSLFFVLALVCFLFGEKQPKNNKL